MDLPKDKARSLAKAIVKERRAEVARGLARKMAETPKTAKGMASKMKAISEMKRDMDIHERETSKGYEVKITYSHETKSKGKGSAQDHTALLIRRAMRKWAEKNGMEVNLTIS